MRWQRLTTCVVLLLGLAAVAVWQWQEYVHQRNQAEQRLRRQADAVMNALAGGVRSHRRQGLCFENQVQIALGITAEAKDVLAVVVATTDGRMVLSAGTANLIDTTRPIAIGEAWLPDGYRLAEKFKVSPPAGGPSCPCGIDGQCAAGKCESGKCEAGKCESGKCESGKCERDCAEPKACPLVEQPADDSPLESGGEFVAVLLLDRSAFDEQCHHIAWARVSVGAAAALVLLCVALAWGATVRLAAARGRADLLESEARHLRELGQAAAGLAHETRNPLGLIRGWTQRLAQSQLDSPEQEQRAQAIVEECDRVTARLNQFLAFARPCEPNLEAVDVADMVDELGAVLGVDLDMKDLVLQCNGSSLDKAVRADREMLRQALFNLVQNAVQFAPPNGVVEVALQSKHDERKRIEVADCGPGVAQESVSSLFSPYFTTRPDGTGMGLAIVRHIATVHGWQAGYEARPDGGSIFWLDGLQSP